MAGGIAALLIEKSKKGSKEPESPTMGACQAILDAIAAKDAGALDAALADWSEQYEGAEKPTEE